ncbi:MAG: CehA/McbA family metallohydrolase [Anaerolineae bacterium]
MMAQSEAPAGLIELSGHLSPQDKQASAYKLLPFRVPAGMGRLEVEYAFSEDRPGGFLQAPGNVLDIGLFDPRGSEFLQARGFRGWSGAARRAFFLAPGEATPGYLPGPLVPGEWQILLGLYRILPEGCDYQVTVRLYKGAPEARAEGAASGPAMALPPTVDRPAWYRGDLHCHTHHSDARGSLADLAAAARRQGLDFVAVTEHNTVSHLPHLAAHAGPDLLLIPGQEITTEQGHANAWGIRRWHEFRCESAEQMARVVDDVHAAGALASINHPKLGGPPWQFGGEERFDCLEVWQAPWFVFNDQSLALWDGLLREGQRLTAVGGSDLHQAPPGEEVEGLSLGQPCTWVYARALSEEAILAGIRAGHVFVSADPAGPRLVLTAEVDGEGRYQAGMGDCVSLPPGTPLHLRCEAEGAAGCTLRIHSLDDDREIEVEDDHFYHEWSGPVGADTYFRAELWRAPEGENPAMQALSNPIYVRVQGDDG